MTRLVAASASLVGQVRTTNEDSVLVAEGLAAVADGMGGHNAGEVASAEAVAVIGSVAGTRSIEDLVAAVHRANREVNDRAANDEELYGMGTTVCVVGLVEHDGIEEVAVLNVGDSRVYLLADSELRRLTEDHSLVEGLVREGRISKEEAEVHPQRNVITRALGVEPLVVVDAWLLQPCDGDRLLLCSDGLFDELDEERIRELLAEGESPEVTARRLAAEADAAGGRDNISVVVVDVLDTGSPPAPLGDRYRRITTPAVDLSDPDDGPRTDTHMAVVDAPAEGDEAGSGDEDVVDEDDELDDGSDIDGEDEDEDLGPDAAAPGGSSPGEQASGARGDLGARLRTMLWVAAVAAVVAVAIGALVLWALQDEPERRHPRLDDTTTTTTFRPTTTTEPSTTAESTTVEPPPETVVPAEPQPGPGEQGAPAHGHPGGRTES